MLFLYPSAVKYKQFYFLAVTYPMLIKHKINRPVEGKKLQMRAFSQRAHEILLKHSSH